MAVERLIPTRETTRKIEPVNLLNLLDLLNLLNRDQLIRKAENLLAGQEASPEELLDLAESLAHVQQTGHARKLAVQARKMEPPASLARILAQKEALYTYQDPDLPTLSKLDRAFRILERDLDLLNTEDQETLGLAGAILKRKWAIDGQKRHLERSLAYYQRGHEQGAEKDLGHTSINTAFVLDLLAQLEEEAARDSGASSPTARERREEARRIRADLIRLLGWLETTREDLRGDYWLLVTLAEAHLGLGDYLRAAERLESAALVEGVSGWQRETAGRQLAELIRLQGEDTGPGSPAQIVLAKLFSGNDSAAKSVLIGKVGLALSGGGFRASLFHIGVLAKLAELDLLRHVEVLSCVSGGSIVGAYYYLKLRKLLQSVPPAKVSRDDYVKLVDEMQREFLAGVQRNIRTRVATNPLKTLGMVLSKRYSRTLRLGALLENELYRRVGSGPEIGEQDGGLWLTKLYVAPGGDASFNPKYDNWKLGAKVPILVLNATSLNTGHNWQFTASWMGEPPVDIDEQIDSNYRLRRLYYDQAPPAHRRVRLGAAVGASASVPGLFEPVELDELYEGLTVRLVDGGVQDNQGVSSLIEQGCNILLVSDASGQMEPEDEPSPGILKVPLRSNSILMSRVRGAQYEDLYFRKTSSRLRGLVFLHLKKDLPVESKPWIGCDQAPEVASVEVANGELTSYGINKKIQKALANVRTDLDSFCDAEASALMTSGYRMVEQALRENHRWLPRADEEPVPWKFLDIEPAMKRAKDNPEGHRRLLRLLEAAHQQAFKVWRLNPVLKWGSMLLGAIGLGGLIFFLSQHAAETIGYRFSVGSLRNGVLLALAGLAIGSGLMRLVNYRKTLAQIALLTGLSFVGWLAAWIHLLVFDPLYLELGKVERFLRKGKDPD